MKIGILTFHSQLNYGGVLQCWALVQSLKGMGHAVVGADRWLSSDTQMLKQEFVTLSMKDLVKFLIRGMLVYESRSMGIPRIVRQTGGII